MVPDPGVAPPGQHRVGQFVAILYVLWPTLISNKKTLIKQDFLVFTYFVAFVCKIILPESQFD